MKLKFFASTAFAVILLSHSAGAYYDPDCLQNWSENQLREEQAYVTQKVKDMGVVREGEHECLGKLNHRSMKLFLLADELKKRELRAKYPSVVYLKDELRYEFRFQGENTLRAPHKTCFFFRGFSKEVAEREGLPVWVPMLAEKLVTKLTEKKALNPDVIYQGRALEGYIEGTSPVKISNLMPFLKPYFLPLSSEPYEEWKEGGPFLMQGGMLGELKYPNWGRHANGMDYGTLGLEGSDADWGASLIDAGIMIPAQEGQPAPKGYQVFWRYEPTPEALRQFVVLHSDSINVRTEYRGRILYREDPRANYLQTKYEGVDPSMVLQEGDPVYEFPQREVPEPVGVVSVGEAMEVTPTAVPLPPKQNLPPQPGKKVFEGHSMTGGVQFDPNEIRETLRKVASKASLPQHGVLGPKD